MIRRTALIALTLAAAFAATAAQAAPLQLRLLETTDIHMNLLDWDYYQDRPTPEFGLARTVSLIKQARSEQANTLLFDNGDLLQGTPLGDHVARIEPLKKGAVHPAIRILNALHYDAANIGNHDFNYGLPLLRQAIAGARFPYVNANAMQATTPTRHAFTPSIVLTRSFKDEAGQTQKLRIGVIGVVPPQILQWDHANLEGRLIATDMVEAAQREAAKLRGKVDVLVVIAHTGLDRDADLPSGSEYMAAQLATIPGVDALLLGHQHAEFPGAQFAGYPNADAVNGRLHGVPAVMPGHWGSHLGQIDLKLDKVGGHWKVLDSKSTLRPIFDAAKREPLVEADPLVGHLIAHEHEGTLQDMRSPVAENLTPIFSHFAMVGDDPSVQIVSDAQAAYARELLKGTPDAALPLLSAAAPFKAGGRQGSANYTEIAAGPLLAKNVADLYVYPNLVTIVKIRGAEVREWLEMSASALRRINPAGPAEQDLVDPNARSYNFDTIDGVTYEIDVTQPTRYDIDGKLVNPQSHRVVGLSYQGKPIDENAQFLVVTNNYRANGGGHFPGLDASRIVNATPMETRQALANYLARAGKVNAMADGNWRIQPVPGVKLLFVSAASAERYLPLVPRIKLVRKQEAGWALYELE